VELAELAVYHSEQDKLALDHRAQSASDSTAQGPPLPTVTAGLPGGGGSIFLLNLAAKSRSLRSRTRQEVETGFSRMHFIFVALLNRADQHHASAVTAARPLSVVIVTTDWVLMEVADALAEPANRRLGRAVYSGKLGKESRLLKSSPHRTRFDPTVDLQTLR